MKNIIIIGIVLLFIGNIVSLVFSADIDILSDSNDVVEFTVETCGFDKNDKHSVNLSLEDVEKLDILFDEIQDKLSNINSREDAEVIFNEAIVRLDDFGLLGDSSIKNLQKMVTAKNYENNIIIKHLEKFILKNHTIIDDNKNYLCLTAGSNIRSKFCGPISRLSLILPYILASIPLRFCSLIIFIFLFLLPDNLSDNLFYSFLASLIAIAYGLLPYIFLQAIATEISHNNPFNILYSIGFGFNYLGIAEYSYYGYPFEILHAPADGWIWTLGLNGIKKWDGLFSGNFSSLPIFGIINRFPFCYYLGAIGFTGIHISETLGNGSNYYLGNTLMINIEYYNPDDS